MTIVFRFVVFFLFAGLSGRALAETKSESRKANWGSGPPGAELIVKGVQSQVFRFVDEIEGKHVVCYFTEYISGGPGGGTSPINCLPLK